MKTFCNLYLKILQLNKQLDLGLEGDGHGGWYKDGEFVAKTEKGRLKFYNKRQKVGGKDPEQSEKEKNLSSPNTEAPPQDQEVAAQQQAAPEQEVQQARSTKSRFSSRSSTSTKNKRNFNTCIW